MGPFGAVAPLTLTHPHTLTWGQPYNAFATYFFGVFELFEHKAPAQMPW